MPKLSKHTVFTPNGAKAVQLVRENPNTPNRKEKEMSNRIKKQFWFTPEEEAEFRRKVALTGLPQSSIIRMLIKGYEPREKPDERFYDVMRELSAIGNNINQLAVKANTLGFVDAPQLKKEAERWHKFQADVERTFLRPDKSDMKWQ